jgi:MFS family permease
MLKASAQKLLKGCLVHLQPAPYEPILNSGVISSLPFIVAVFTTILGGWLGDRFIASGARLTIVRKSFAIGGIMSAAIFTVLLAYIDDTSADIALLALAIGALGLCTAAVNAVAVDVAPRHLVSSLTSIQTFGANLIASFAPVITGLLVSSTNNFQLPMLVCAGVAVIVGCGAYIFIIGDIDRPIDMQAP